MAEIDIDFGPCVKEQGDFLSIFGSNFGTWCFRPFFENPDPEIGRKPAFSRFVFGFRSSKGDLSENRCFWGVF